MNNLNKKTSPYLIPSAFLCWVVASYFSVGHHHGDEHFQIIEYLSYKTNTSNWILNSWEFKTQMRPWLQPFFYYILIWPFVNVFHLDPFKLSWIIRLATASISFLSAYQLFLYARHQFSHFQIKNFRIFNYLFFLWPLPYLISRTSSENLGGALFILALVFYQKRKWSFFNGLLFLASFWIRFQIGFCIPVLLFFFFKSYPKSKRLSLTLGVLTGLVVAVIIDFWGYGLWTLTPWNYFYQNIVLKQSEHFGVHPYWWYLSKSFVKLGILWGAMLIIGQILFWIKWPKHLFTWISFFFLLGHFLVPHKELRFLFPLILLYTYCACSVFICGHNKLSSFFRSPLLYKLNLLVFTLFLFKPAHTPIHLYKKVYQLFIKNLYVIEKSPKNFVTLEMPFYRRGDLNLKVLHDFTQLESTMFINGSNPIYLLTDTYPQYLQATKIGCKPIFTSYPMWLVKADFTGRLKKSSLWNLYSCRQVH